MMPIVMASAEFNLLVAFETHSVKDIRKILDAGFDVASLIKGKTVVNSLLEMYSRSDAFPACLQLLLDRGAVLDDPRIAPVLLDDAEGVRAALHADPALIGHRTSMISTFTPLIGASLLHVAAEYGSMKAVRVLLEMGADVNARASLDEYGLNGHTPIFHTVNSNGNRSAAILHALLDAGAAPDVRLDGITWGRGFEWETTCFDVTPISYAQLGLLPQVHRREHDIYANIRRLLEAAGRRVPPLDNVPNRYLNPKG
jgi:ankyrin repeat protein